MSLSLWDLNSTRQIEKKININDTRTRKYACGRFKKYACKCITMNMSAFIENAHTVGCVACKMSEVEEKKNFACLNGFLLFTLYVRDLVLSINCSHSHSILFSTGLNDLFQPCSTDAHEKNI